MTPDEFETVKEYLIEKNPRILTAYARHIEPSPDFLEYIYRALERRVEPVIKGKKSIPENRTIALLIELLPFPKSDPSFSGSVFYMLSPVFNKAPSTIRDTYNKYKKDAKYFAGIANQYKKDPSSVDKTLHPMAQVILDLAEDYCYLLQLEKKLSL